MSKNQHLFEIAPPQEVEVGTEILDPTMPSNLDFQEKQKQQIQMTEIKPGKSQANPVKLGTIDLQNINIKSYTIKGKVVFNLQPQLKVTSVIPSNTQTYPVKCFSDQQSPGFKGFWQSIVGYSNRQMHINQGYIYLLLRQKQGLVVLNYWRLTNLFKIFLDLQDSKMRLVIKQQNSQHLITKDYESGQIRDLLARIGQQINAIGLSLVG